MPFALLGPTAAPAVGSVGESFSYCPIRQLNVTPGGAAFVEVADFFGPSMTVNSSGTKKDDD
uniref:hypothetical protein n=2 Tax=Bacillati TaxID=1783272 RepID=UPI003670C40F